MKRQIHFSFFSPRNCRLLVSGSFSPCSALQPLQLQWVLSPSLSHSLPVPEKAPLEWHSQPCCSSLSVWRTRGEAADLEFHRALLKDTEAALQERSSASLEYQTAAPAAWRISCLTSDILIRNGNRGEAQPFQRVVSSFFYNFFFPFLFLPQK